MIPARKPDQHHVRSIGDIDRGEVEAHLRKAIHELQAIADNLPPVLIDGEIRQRGTAHNYIENVALRVAETAFDCTLNIAEIAASLGNSGFDKAGVRAGFNEILNDELFDARQWADGELEEA